jgi:hypothetical protein
VVERVLLAPQRRRDVCLGSERQYRSWQHIWLR